MTLGYLDIKELIETGALKSENRKLEPQPASLDLPLTEEIYRMPCSLLPKKGESIRKMIEDRALYKISGDQLLELGHYYLVRSDIQFNLPEVIQGNANNKSSSGRINLQGRLMLDGVSLFDTIPKGYQGEAWVELHPELAPIHPKNLPSVNQIRLREGRDLLKGEELIEYHLKTPILYERDGTPVKPEDLEIGPDQESLNVGVCLNEPNIRGWKGIRRTHKPLYLQDGVNAPNLFFEPISTLEENLIMLRDEFYILGSNQRVSNPLDVCITMRAFQAEHGEFRSHFAGFFDPGNGYGKNGEENGFTVTMEVIPMETAIEIRHGQPMFSIEIEKLRRNCPAEAAYGKPRGSHYHCDPGPKLARWFKP